MARQIHEGVEISTTPLIQAALKGHADAVRVLTSRGAEVNKPETCLGQTPLHAAAQEDLVPVIELLMSKGARHDVRDKYGQTPLHIAAFKGHNEDSLLSPVLLKKAKSPLSISLSSISMVLMSIRPTIKDTSLIKAAQHGHLEIVKLLLEKGAVVDQAANDGNTALNRASLTGHLEVV